MGTPYEFGGPPRYAHQRAALRKMINTRGVTALLMAPGTGKQQPNSEPVLTPDGWREIGDISPGDLVIGRNGKPVRVLSVHPQTDDRVYRVTFNDGTWTYAGPDHLWSARTHTGAVRGGPWRVITTEYLRTSLNRRWEIPLTEPVDHPEQDLPVDPYLVGVIVGDGSVGRTCKLTTDTEIISALGLADRSRPHRTSTYTADVCVPKVMHRGAVKPGRSWEKEIPDQYMISAPAQRLALLQGLLDTDGSPMRTGGVEFSTTSVRLFDQVAELVESLGGIARRAEPRVTYYPYRGEIRQGRESYRLNVKLPVDLEPFRLSRKLSRWVRPSKYPPKRVICSIEFSHREPSVCIRVDSTEHLYLTRHHIVTHNTAPVIDYTGLLALKSPRREARVLIIAPLVAIDTWVEQMSKFASPQVHYWAEALGGTLKMKAEALAARGGNPFPRSLSGTRKIRNQKPRALHRHKAVHLLTSDLIDAQDGPDALPGPKIILEVVNVDMMSSRSQVGGRTMADVVLDSIKRFDPDLVVVDECHPSGTLVSTPDGSRPIEDLREGDEVLSFNGSGIIVTRVTHTFSRETTDPLWNLGGMRATPEHPVWTENRGFIPISEVTDGDTILRMVRCEVRTEEGGLDSVPLHQPRGADRSGTRRVYNIETEAGTYWADGVLVHNSHKIKSPSSNSSRLLARISQHVPRRMILTGTVFPHSPLDAFGQWRFLDPYAFGTPGKPATWTKFRNRYARMGGWMGREVLGFKNLDEMQLIMARNAIVAKKEDVLDLPPATDVVIPVHLSAQEQRAYREMKNDLATQLGPGSLATVPNRLAQMMRLRQITSGHLPDDHGTVTMIGDSKARVIRSLVHDTLSDESRVVVFCLFTAEINKLAETLAEKGTTVEVITGSTPDAERMRIRRRFGSTDPARIILIAQIKTMSLAVNELITASHCVFASLSQQRDDLVQARDRLNRIGQTKPTTFWFAVVPGTVDEVILETHTKRGDMESALLRHVLEADQGVAA